jgi:hypothetical protein
MLYGILFILSIAFLTLWRGNVYNKIGGHGETRSPRNEIPRTAFGGLEIIYKG